MEAIEKIRELRKKENITLKPSPYLRSMYFDEVDGKEQPVKIRNYQAIGILNLLMVPCSLLSDDTGLGKTLVTLSTIGYVWLKEPEYVPIVITKKSALFQWEKETKKFMQDMEAVTVFGPPSERDDIYAKFFSWKSAEDKSLIIMTYDNMLKDGLSTVVKDKSYKAPKEDKKALKEARDKAKELKEKFNDEKEKFNIYMKTRPESIIGHMRELLKPRDKDAKLPKAPIGWTQHDQDIYDWMVGLRDAKKEADQELQRWRDKVAPSIITHGVLNYMHDLKMKQPNVKFLLIFDEIHVLKNYKGKMHQTAAQMAKMSDRKIGMTATPVKNRLMEFFSIFGIIEPTLFPKVTHFQNRYCLMKMQQIKGGRQVPIVVGHSKEQLSAFVDQIEPYYLSRRKHEVAKELPKLITREIKCELSDEQEELYDMAEAGLLNKAEVSETMEEEENGAEVLSSLVLVQQACNAPQLICDEDDVPFKGKSSKIEAILDLLQNELDEKKVIIFSRFEKFVSLIEEELKKNKIKCTRITGKENKASVREQNKVLFQDKKSGVNVILITLAGSESINLQSAEYTIYADSPWSWGDYVQLTGRNIRIGSTHESVMAIHLVAIRQNGKPTIDDHVIKILRRKKQLADTVAGKSLENGLEFTETEMAKDLMQMIVESAQQSTEEKKIKKIHNIKSVSSSQKQKAKEKKESNLSILDVDLTDI